MKTQTSESIMGKVNNGVLLTTADRQIESLVEGGRSSQTFTESLYEAVLFHQGVVLPDIFAFISSVIAEQSFSTTKTDLEYAIESGVVIPAFRSKTESFCNALDVITNQKIRGVNRNSKAIAIRLDAARNNCKDGLRHISWPDDISKEYANCMIVALTEISSPSYKNEFLKNSLFLTGEFITKYRLIEQVQEEVFKSNGELRRGFLLESILKILNTIKDSGRVVFDDVENLILHPACENDIAVSMAVRNIVCLANLIYQRNMASKFESNTYLSGSVYPKDVHDVATVAIDTSSLHRCTHSQKDATDRGEFARFQVTIPSIHQLKAVGMKRLLEIRDSHRHGYFSYLQAWQDGEGTYQDVERSLLDYSCALTQAVNSEAPFVNVVLARFTESDKTGVQAAVKLAMDVLATDSSSISSFSAGLGSLANITYSWVTQRPVEISIFRRANIVV